MTDIATVRLLIGDTLSVQFTDADIQTFLTIEGDVVKLAAALALEAWLSELARDPSSEVIGDYQYNKTAQRFMENQAKAWRKQVEETPAFDWAEMDLLGVEEST